MTSYYIDGSQVTYGRVCETVSEYAALEYIPNGYETAEWFEDCIWNTIRAEGYADLRGIAIEKVSN